MAAAALVAEVEREGHGACALAPTVTLAMEAVGGDSSSMMLIWAPGKVGSVAPVGLLSVTVEPL